MIINSNIPALNTYNQMSQNNNDMQDSMEKLSSGQRINKAADDAAGLAISEKMRGQIRGLDQASRNSQDGISMIQTAEGSLQETQSMLQRMRELSVQSANGTNTDSDREELQKEVDQLAQQVTQTANDTEFNTKKLLNGGLDEKFQIGANEGQNLDVEISAMDAESLGVARDTTTGEISGATNVEGEEVDLSSADGNELIGGAQLSLTADDTASKASVTANDITVETSGDSSEFNGYSVSTVNDSSNEGIQVDHAAKTITITQDQSASSGSGSDASTLAGSISESGGTSNSPDISNLTFSGGVASGESTDNNLSDGLADDEVKLTLTNSDSGNSEDVIVKDDATSASFTSSEFGGLNLSLDGEQDGSTAATIDISKNQSSAASFNNGEVTDAVAAAGIDISSQEAADEAITTINDAIENVSAQRAEIGASQNRLDHTISNLDNSSENLQAAESRIRDVDMAKEMMEQTRASTLAQASQSMLAQANQQPQQVLQLLQ